MRRLAFALGAALALAGPAQAAMLVGAARVPAAARDGVGETLGGFGSGMALVPGSLKRTRNGVSGTLAMVPDRGWNTQGTGDYRARCRCSIFPCIRRRARRMSRPGWICGCAGRFC